MASRSTSGTRRSSCADGRRLSLVDVPGHERFVRTMVAGATGIDLFLLVIDAGEGARPQTHEHLAILRLLGVEAGVVAVTKADAVDAETLELAVLEAQELVPGCRGGRRVRPHRARGWTSSGRPSARAADGVDRVTADRPPRLYVDRVFTLRGIGTVVTGTLWSGTVGDGDELSLEPGGRAVRVRSVQVHDRPVARAEAGQRVALSLPGVERDDVRAGRRARRNRRVSGLVPARRHARRAAARARQRPPLGPPRDAPDPGACGPRRRSIRTAAPHGGGGRGAR